MVITYMEINGAKLLVGVVVWWCIVFFLCYF